MRVFRLVLALGGVSVLALALAGAAPSDSTLPAQLIIQTAPPSLGGGVALELFPDYSAPAPARATFYVPAGYGLDTSVAPGTSIGSIDTIYSTDANPFSIAEGHVKTGDPSSLPPDPPAHRAYMRRSGWRPSSRRGCLQRSGSTSIRPLAARRRSGPSG